MSEQNYRVPVEKLIALGRLVDTPGGALLLRERLSKLQINFEPAISFLRDQGEATDGIASRTSTIDEALATLRLLGQPRSIEKFRNRPDPVRIEIPADIVSVFQDFAKEQRRTIDSTFAARLEPCQTPVPYECPR